ncbi:uncharacterized protein LOC132759689 isoform X2 [Ruditapes philippinarum]|uniref:uncharacterized protein LOC132759689 isoform X2 n=1 Tax=Ruditapes philippinarum TaxID=129788 RepID=UPI00295BF143|nr:uncharacterized protein LOC132759689 isoform X2 [Ruditapes philippinarum]
MTSNILPYGFKPPSEGYEFDNLIADLSQAISEQELENLKQRFKDVQHVRTPREMFVSLRNMGFINNYNILYIQQIVRVLDREDLVEILLKYAQMFEEDTVLHFVQKTTIINDRFSLVQFHIKGKGISETGQLEKFRSEVSRLLLCPIQEVIISGIQATNSTILTLMIPTLYANFLAKQLEKQSQRIISSFMLLNVDLIISDNNEFQLQVKGELYEARKRSTEHKPVQSIKQESRTPTRRMDTEQTKHPQTLKKIKIIQENKEQRAQEVIQEVCSSL